MWDYTHRNQAIRHTHTTHAFMHKISLTYVQSSPSLSHTYTYIHTRTHTHTCTHTHMHTHTHAHTHAHVHPHTQHTYGEALHQNDEQCHKRWYMCFSHTHIHTCTRTHSIHTEYTHTNTHTHTLSLSGTHAHNIHTLKHLSKITSKAISASVLCAVDPSI